jgi:GNAT superfamily N-acetyltransferase
MTIERAKDTDFAELKELWSVVFDEEADFLEKFFNLRFYPDSIFVAREQGKIISALHALPSFYHQNNQIHRCAFIVGAATYENFRKKGIMSHLLSYCRQNLNCPITLFPAVRPFYEKNGYITTGELLRFDLTGITPLQADKEVSLSKEELDTIYMKATATSGALMRDSLAWQFLLDGYGLLAVQGAYAFIKDNIAVEAMAIDEESAQALLGLLTEKKIRACSVLYDSPFVPLLSDRSVTILPMGMSTATFMQGCYIAEQY